MTQPAAQRPILTRSWLRAATAALVCATSTLGCRNNTELLESELRQKEEQLATLKQDVDRRDLDIRAMELEIAQLHRACVKQGKPAGNVIVVKEVTLGRTSGGYDEDPKLPGDEALQLIVEPRDADNQVVKVPAALHVAAYEILPQGQKAYLSSWDVSSGELRRKWEEPLIGGSAYRVTLKWKTQPTTERLRVVIKLTTLDGQEYEADRDVSIRLPDLPRRRQTQPGDVPMPPGAGPNCPPGPVLQPHHCSSGEEELAAPQPLLARPQPQPAATPPKTEEMDPPPPEPPPPPSQTVGPPPPVPPVTPASYPSLAPPKLQPPSGARKPLPPWESQ